MGDFHWKFRGYYRAFAYCVFGCDTARSLLLLLPAARCWLWAALFVWGCELRATRALWVAVHCAVINIVLLLICCAAAAVAAVCVLPGHSAAGGV